MQKKKKILQHVDQGKVLQLELANKPIELEHSELNCKSKMLSYKIFPSDSEIDEMITDYNSIAVQDDFEENKIPLSHRSHRCGSLRDYVCPHCKTKHWSAEPISLCCEKRES